MNKTRPVYNNSFKDIKSDKISKGNKSNVMNDECKGIIKSTQSLDDIPKKVSIHITKFVDSYSSLSDKRIKWSQLILEKLDRNINVPHISKPIEVMSQV